MSTYLQRGPLTQHLIDTLSPVILVGDAKAPDTGGWDLPPNDPSSTYTPYTTMYPLTAQEPTGALVDPSTEYRLPYSFAIYGVSRDQVEFYADLVRKTVVDLARTVVVLGDFSWGIQQARVNSIGGISRSDNTEPPEFTQTDVVSLYITKEF